MKKFAIVFFIFVCLMCVGLCNYDFIKSASMPKDAVYSIYVSKDFVPNVEGVSCVKNGSINIVSCNAKQADKLYSSFDKESIVGQSFKFESIYQEFLDYLAGLDVKVVSTENFDNITSVYCYSDKIVDGIYLSSGKVNLQIAYSNGYVTVGSPVIIGSF